MKCRGTYIMGLSISWGCPYTNVVTKNFPFQEYITIASIYIKRNAFFSLRNLENRKHLNITKNESTSLKIQLKRQIRKYLQDRQRVKGLRAWGLEVSYIILNAQDVKILLPDQKVRMAR